MAFCIAESYVRLKRYDLNDVANNFARWLFEGFWSSKDRAFDVGQATYNAVNAIHYKGSLKNGTEETQGNGSIMRFAPSFIMNYGAPDNVMLHEISDLTHCSQAVRDVVDLMAAILTEHVEGKRTQQQSIYKSREDVNVSGWSVSTLQAALWAFNATNDYESGMIQAVNLGGDSDSIGAVYGQIAGAYYGFDAIPSSWVKAVKDYEKVNELIESTIAVKMESEKE
jgi:ADP-ribosyl-[dinitrogen reductase] hydrolase